MRLIVTAPPEGQRVGDLCGCRPGDFLGSAGNDRLEGFFRVRPGVRGGDKRADRCDGLNGRVYAPKTLFLGGGRQAAPKENRGGGQGGGGGNKLRQRPTQERAPAGDRSCEGPLWPGGLFRPYSLGAAAVHPAPRVGLKKQHS